MYDYRLKVFDTVARRLSFTKAAEELCITQPAVTRHVRELEKRYGVLLFERRGNTIFLTEAGQLVLKHTEMVRDVSRKLEYEISQINETRKGSLKMGASTTIAQYVLPPLLASFHSTFGDVRLTMLNANTERVERALLRGDIEFGMIEGDSKRRDVRYLPFAMDEIVLVARRGNPRAGKGPLALDEIMSVPLLLREPGSGTLEVLSHALKHIGMKLSGLNTEITLGSSEAIKTYLMHSDCMTFISQHSVRREIESGELEIVDVEGLAIRRQFLFIAPQGPLGGLPDAFMRFASISYRPPGPPAAQHDVAVERP